MALAALVYIYRIAETTTVTPVTDDYIRDGLSHSLQGRIIPPTSLSFAFTGPSSLEPLRSWSKPLRTSASSNR